MKSKIKTLIIALTVIMFGMIACEDKDEKVDNSNYYFDPPTGITATKANNNSVRLTWNEVASKPGSKVSHYEISYRTNLDSEDTHKNAGTSQTTSYEHNYYYVSSEATTLYYSIKTHPRESGYIASGWSAPVSVNIR